MPRSWTLAAWSSLAIHVVAYDPYGSHGHNPCGASSDKFQSCWETRCCSTPGFLCFKKVGVDEASCLPWIKHRSGEHEPCESDAQWLCPTTHMGPGWDHEYNPVTAEPASSRVQPSSSTETPLDRTDNADASRSPGCLHGEAPVAPFSNCFEARCCEGYGSHGCFRRFGRPFAQCRPYDMHRASDGGCADSDLWICPESWMPQLAAAPSHRTFTPAPSTSRPADDKLAQSSSDPAAPPVPFESNARPAQATIISSLLSPPPPPPVQHLPVALGLHDARMSERNASTDAARSWPWQLKLAGVITLLCMAVSCLFMACRWYAGRVRNQRARELRAEMQIASLRKQMHGQATSGSSSYCQVSSLERRAHSDEANVPIGQAQIQ